MIRPSAQGSVTVVVMLGILVVLGFASVAFYAGHLTERRIKIQTAADQASLAAAAHLAEGLNLIAVNNLSIASSLHLGSAINIAAAYGAVARSFTMSLDEALQDLVVLTLGTHTSTIQKHIYNPLARVAGGYWSAANGMTKMNQFMAQHWAKPASIKALDVGRMNVPGAIFLPLQNQHGHVETELQLKHGLAQVSVRSAICAPLAASLKSLGDSAERDNPLGWLQGPVTSLGAGSLANAIGGFTHVIDLVTTFALRFGYVDCGIGLKVPIIEFFRSLGRQVHKDPSLGLRIRTFIASSMVHGDPGADFGIDEAWRANGVGDCARYDIACHTRRNFVSTSYEVCRNSVAAAINTGLFAPSAELAAAYVASRSLLEMRQRRAQLSNRAACLPYTDNVGRRQCYRPWLTDDDIRDRCPNDDNRCKDEWQMVSDRRWMCPLATELQQFDLCRSAKIPHLTDPVGFDYATNPCADWQSLESAKSPESWQFFDFSKQADAWIADASGRAETLGYIVPNKNLATAQRVTPLSSALQIGVIAANPLRNEDGFDLRKCGAALTSVRQDQRTITYCEEHPLTILSGPIEFIRKLDDGSWFTSLQRFSAGEIPISAAAQSFIARSQYAFSFASAVYDGQTRLRDPIPARGSAGELFWPAWRSSLVVGKDTWSGTLLDKGLQSLPQNLRNELQKWLSWSDDEA